MTEQAPVVSQPEIWPTGFSPLPRLARFALPYRRQAVIAVIALVLAAGGILALGQGLRLMVDGGYLTRRDSQFNPVLIYVFAIVMVVALATAVRFYFVSWLGERIACDLRLAVFGHLLELDVSYFDTNSPAEIASRLTTDTTLLETIIGSSLSVFVRNVLMLIGAVLMLLVTSFKLTLLALLAVSLMVGPILFFGRRVRRLSRQSQDRIAEVGSYVNETLQAIRVVQAFTHEDIDRRRFGARIERAFASAVSRIRQRSLLMGMAILLAFAAVGLIVWVGGRDVVSGRISAGQLTSFLFYVILVAGSLSAISEVVGDLLRAAGAAERLFELLDAPSHLIVPVHPLVLPRPLRGELSLEQLSFAYPAHPELAALKQISLRIEAGERIALVGPSGAGKSTLLQLILRFYDPQEGRILFDGVDIRQVALSDLRARIAIVPQEPVLFAGDVYENIRYGRATASDEEIAEAARAAHVLEFVDRLPQGFATHLGERGVRLSGGQRQRVAIARAILRDPVLLLLDEATSSLDAQSEHQVQQALDSLMQGRTSIIIAHRLATVLKCDRIAVMDQGRIHAVGTHQQLLRQSPLYARLAALQFGESAASIGH